MMDKIFNIETTFKAKADDKGVTIRGMASTDDIDRAGDIILPEAWSKGGLSNFKNNPVILFNHNYDKPIGRGTSVSVTDKGLELEAYISNSAADNVAGLIKDGVLGTFSVGFAIKDADYISETDGLKIKDAELFEVSVVSVPCNQAATFSLSKAFNSEEEWSEFKQTFTNSVDLAGQSLAKEEANASNIASDTPDGQTAPLEIKMETKNDGIDLDAYAKKIAEETAAKIAVANAEQKAREEKAAKEAEEAAAAKAAAEEATKTTIKTGIETGVDKLVADMEARFAEKDAQYSTILEEFKKDLEEKNAELTAMRESKRVFGDRSGSGSIASVGKELMYGHLLGVFTGKGWNTEYSKNLFEKAGIVYDQTGGAPDIDQEVSSQIEKEVMLNLRTANLFREIKVNGASTVLPIQPDVEGAVWQTGAAAAGNLENRGASDSTYVPAQVILNAYRLISQTFMDNNIDEEVLVNLMPMLTDSVARAHARAVDIAIINGNGTFTGLEGYATASSGGLVDIDGATIAAGNSATLTASLLMQARKDMGKYGMDPTDIAYIVSQSRYYDLINDPEFTDVNEVGSDVATKLTGTVGAVYGTPVIVSDNLEAEAGGGSVAYAVNLRNYVIPRLRGITVEKDYEVGNQRNVIVATQSLGFNELVADAASNRSCVKVITTA